MTHYGSDVVYQELVAVRKGWWASCVLDCVNLHLADFYNHTSHLLVYLYERVLFVLLPSLFTAPTSWFSILCSSHFPFVSDSDKLMHTSRNNGTWTHSLSLITVSSNAHTHTHARAHTHIHTHTLTCQGNNGIRCVGGWRQDNLPKLLRDYCKVLLEQRSFTNCSEISWRPHILHTGCHAEGWLAVRSS